MILLLLECCSLFEWNKIVYFSEVSSVLCVACFGLCFGKLLLKCFISCCARNKILSNVSAICDAHLHIVCNRMLFESDSGLVKLWCEGDGSRDFAVMSVSTCVSYASGLLLLTWLSGAIGGAAGPPILVGIAASILYVSTPLISINACSYSSSLFETSSLSISFRANASSANVFFFLTMIDG